MPQPNTTDTDSVARGGGLRAAVRRLPRWLEVALFFALSVFLVNIIGIPMTLSLASMDTLNLLVPVMQFTPFLAALIIFWIIAPGRFRDVFATRRAGALRWSAIGVGLIALVAAVQLGVALLTGTWRLAPVEAFVGLLPVLVAVLVMQSAFAIGEEFGWRGWLVDRVGRWGFWRLSLAFMPLWMVWHLPVLATLSSESTFDKVIYFLSMGPWAPLLFALRLRSGSVWPAVLAHGAINSVRVYLLQSVPANPTDSVWIEVLGWVLLLAVAAWLMRPSVRRTIPELSRPGIG